MPSPLNFSVKKKPLCPTPTESYPAAPTLFLHYAIKGPGNPSAITVCQPFDHVTEGTVAG